VAVKKIENREMIQVSMGYYADVIPRDGIYEDESFDTEQKNIRYNHCALVEIGRAGENIKIVVDHLKKEKERPKMGKILINGLTYDGVPEVEREINVLRTDKESLKGQIDKVTGEFDSLKDQFKKFKEKYSEEEINKIVKDNVNSSLEILKKFPSIEFDSFIPAEMKKKVILDSNPNVDLKGKSADYIEGFYLSIQDTGNKEVNKEEAKKVVDSTGSKNKVLDAQEMRAKMIKLKEEAHLAN
jgi:predicted nuclease with TOPRIM domain